MENLELDWLKRWALYSPSAVAFKDIETSRDYTYRDCFDIANRLAAALEERYGIERGDRVAVLSTNRIETVFLYFALIRLGAILVPMNFRLAPRELDHILRDSGAGLLVFEENFKANVEQLTQKSRLLLEFAELQKYCAQGISRKVEFRGTFEDISMILYTSGTTGAPKGAMLTNQMIFWNSVNTGLRLNLTQNDVTVAFSPLFHTGGWNVLLTPFLHRGAKTVFLKAFDADLILKICEREKVTIFFGVPTTLDMMARSSVFPFADLKSVRYAVVGGEPMPIPLIQKWNEKGIPVRQGYGLTEFGPNVFSLNEEHAIGKSGSIGFPNFYIHVRIVDDRGIDLPPGEIGELILRGPMCMKGYWNNESATKETIRDGWLHTGDLVRQDDEGFFYVVGRKKDMFISGGENVYPVEIEKILLTHAKVREAAVVGVKDEKWGEVGKAFIVPKENVVLTETELTEFCRNQLAKFKIPKHYRFLSELPKGDSGKILKRALV